VNTHGFLATFAQLSPASLIFHENLFAVNQGSNSSPHRLHHLLCHPYCMMCA